MAYECSVSCDCCGQKKIEWDRAVAYTTAREFARSRGWKVGAKIGWVCPRCAEEERWRERELEG